MSSETELKRFDTISSWEEVPQFADEREEAEFWRHTTLPHALMNASVQTSEGRESASITLRFDPRFLARIKRLARSRFLDYQSMMKQWLSERLEKEI